jgi:hypothetical protein
MNIRRIAAAAGFATGAALAFAPLASADPSSNDAASTIDSFLSAAFPAPATPIDLEISFDGYTIYDGGGSAEAVTTTGDYSFAIASGADSYAEATGIGGSAAAYGAGAAAYADGGTGDYALASGTDANAEAGSLASGATGNNYDSAIDIGNNGSDAFTNNAGAYAGNGSLQEVGGFSGTDVGTDSNDSAYEIGNNTAGVSNSGAFAGYYNGLSGNGNTAYDAGNNSGDGDGAYAVEGNNNYASDSGNNTSTEDYAYAGQGNSNSAIADTSYSNGDSGVYAFGGNGNYAYVYGPDNSTADAYDGNSNVAYVDDPFGTAGSPDSAIAGGFSNDLAEVLFTHGNATADTAPLLYDIVSLFGPLSGTF